MAQDGDTLRAGVLDAGRSVVAVAPEQSNQSNLGPFRPPYEEFRQNTSTSRTDAAAVRWGPDGDLHIDLGPAAALLRPCPDADRPRSVERKPRQGAG